MKKTLAVLGLCAMVVGLAGCEPGENVPGATLVGATAGGLIASQVFSGQGAFAGVLAGALIGGVVGNYVGQYMDRQDRANMESAIVNTPIDSEARWTNNKTDVTYVVRPVRDYRSHGRRCRTYQTRVKIEGKWRKAYGKACQRGDGRWKIVK